MYIIFFFIKIIFHGKEIMQIKFKFSKSNTKIMTIIFFTQANNYSLFTLFRANRKIEIEEID